jgi:hypothetical protein
MKNQEIPEKFYKGDDHPTAYTSGELKRLLDELPDDFPINQGYGDGGVVVVVYNYKHDDAHIQFEEVEED